MTEVIIFHFGLLFALLTPNSPKNQNFKQMKKDPRDTIILHKCTKNHNHVLYCSWDIAHDGCHYYFSFWSIFCLFTPLTAQKIKIKKKNEKNAWRYHFTHVCQKLWSNDVLFPKYGARQTDAWMDRWRDRKSDILRSVPWLKMEWIFYIEVQSDHFKMRYLISYYKKLSNSIQYNPWYFIN